MCLHESDNCLTMPISISRAISKIFNASGQIVTNKAGPDFIYFVQRQGW